jgi:hypothetical protein
MYLKNTFYFLFLIASCYLFLFFGCKKENGVSNTPPILTVDTSKVYYDGINNNNGIPLPIPKTYKTKKVVVIVIDGPRYSESFGDSTGQYIQPLLSLFPQACFYSNFYNDGVTNTQNGMTAIATGNYNILANNGTESPYNASFLHALLFKNKLPNEKAWFVCSKDKLMAMSGCSACVWDGVTPVPSTDCGISGLNSGYRDDSTTYTRAQSIIKTHHPDALFISFREPDFSGHLGDWNAYTTGLKKSSEYTKWLIDSIQNDPYYKNNTSFFITNDHGRHLDSFGGFVNHGDGCEGCKHISLIAIGPDFKTNTIVNTRATQIDIATTINELMGLGLHTVRGRVMTEMLK